jgi:hypothetical protein
MHTIKKKEEQNGNLKKRKPHHRFNFYYQKETLVKETQVSTAPKI